MISTHAGRRRLTWIVAVAAVVALAAAPSVGLPSAAAGPTAVFSKESDWGAGWEGLYTIKNPSAATLSSWTVEFDLPAGTVVGGFWKAQLTKRGQHYAFRNYKWNGNVPAGGSMTFGFTGYGPGKPTGCKINGAPCSGSGDPTAVPTRRPPTQSPSPGPTRSPSATPSATPSPTTAPPSAPRPTTSPSSTPPPTTSPPSGGEDLDDPAMKEVAMQIVATGENSSTDWRAHFSQIKDTGDGRGYTAGIVGFCSGTSDMLQLVENYTRRSPGNVLAKYLPALRAVNGTDSHEGLDPGFPADWRLAAQDPLFQDQQEAERDSLYFDPAVTFAKQDGLRALGQFAYFDAAVMHGYSGLESIRQAAVQVARPPAEGGDEIAWLTAFLDARVAEMKTEAATEDTSRVDTAQRVWLDQGNLDLTTPLEWSVYGESFRID